LRWKIAAGKQLASIVKRLEQIAAGVNGNPSGKTPIDAVDEEKPGSVDYDGN
jgi:hypothetical protein